MACVAENIPMKRTVDTSTKSLVKFFQETEHSKEPSSKFRGFIMRVIQHRDPAGFNKWLDHGAPDSRLHEYIRG